LATAEASAYGAPKKVCGPKISATVLAAVYTTDTATTPTSDTSPTTSRGFGALIVLADGVLDTVGATAAIFAATGCGSGVDVVDALVAAG
jgi:hypothetical protein